MGPSRVLITVPPGNGSVDCLAADLTQEQAIGAMAKRDKSNDAHAYWVDVHNHNQRPLAYSRLFGLAPFFCRPRCLCSFWSLFVAFCLTPAVVLPLAPFPPAHVSLRRCQPVGQARIGDVTVTKSRRPTSEVNWSSLLVFLPMRYNTTRESFQPS